ncbi:MAG TPA: alanine--tRNA ligase [Terriglobales bacterium]|nr:alanine--tRNA ligase [Terriglobales bacterium]
MPTGSQIREQFLRFFESKGHRRLHSSSLVPANDPTLLFTNAGMNQFKDVFLGLEKRDYRRATTSQKCVRAGGKHNDLENVGFTNRHLTFFEMLGNFSFGDYFKREAIQFAWELVTSKQWYGLPQDKLYATIFVGEEGVPRDEEAERGWLEVGVPKDRVFAMGMKDNFWAMGETGPCGPCSEIHYDLGPRASGEGHTDCRFPCDCGRYVEIWNLVFMQFDRDAGGNLNPLPKPCVDTGMGLERITSVLQDKLAVFETDLFVPLIAHAAELTGVDLKKELESETKTHSAASLRVIADHARATTFLISDGVLPSNEGRGYVLRKIMRRAIRHGRLLGSQKPFLYEMVHAVRDLMKDAYPELVETAEQVSQVVYAEETRFAHTLAVGLSKLEDRLSELERETTEVNQQASHIYRSDLPGEGTPVPPSRPALQGKEGFYFYETFGLPFDFIVDACRDRFIDFDQQGFSLAQEEAAAKARASWKGGAGKQTASPVYRDLKKTEFVGYRQTSATDCEILAIVKNGQGVRELAVGEEGEVILDHTPFYADSGGQVGDIGVFYDNSRTIVVADVNGCYMPVQGVRAHKVRARQPLYAGMKVDAVVHTEVREKTMRHHTATHLLHAALREVLGKHVKQAGSLVDPAHLRFDFSHFTAVEDEELQDVEDLANKEILRNERVQVIEDVPIDVAINEYKAMALFGEKYGERVRVIKIGDFSTELCGGTHTGATGEIGLLKVLREQSVSSGVRRVEAVAGTESLRHFRTDHELESVARNYVRADHNEDHGSIATALRYEIESKDDEIRRLRRELEQARMKSAAAGAANLEEKVRLVNGVKVLTHRADNLDRPQMRTLVDNLRNKLGSGVVVLGSANDGRVALIVGVTKDLMNRVPAGKVLLPVAQKVGGKGGGRPDLAEGGGEKPEQLDAALSESYVAVEKLLA